MAQQFPITAGDPSTRFTLPTGFLSVKVDNPTGQWLHLLDTFSYVPPGAIGAIFTLDGLPNPGAEWAAPPGVTQPGATSGQQAALTYYEIALSPTAGTVIQVTSTVSGTVGVSAISSTVSTNAPQQLLGTITTSTGSDVSQQYNVPAGTQALAITLTPQANAKHVLFQGFTSGVSYLELYYFTQGIYALPWVSAVDATVTFTVASFAAQSLTARLVALTESVPEFLQLFAPPELAPNQAPLQITPASINANSSIALVTESGSVEVFPFDFYLTAVPASGTVNFTLSAGVAATPNQLGIGAYQPASGQPLPLSFRGAPLGRGRGLYVTNRSSSALTLYGHGTYSLG